MAETSKRSADEQGQALREAQGNAEKLATELAAARREVQSQVSVASSARDEAAGVKEAAERSADEQRRALQQERDKTEKLATELCRGKVEPGGAGEGKGRRRGCPGQSVGGGARGAAEGKSRSNGCPGIA